MPPRVVIIGIDGATFEVLDPLIEEGVMPFLGRFAAEGTRAPLRTIVPALTQVATKGAKRAVIPTGCTATR